MTEELPILYSAVNFCSLFEVAVGINLLFSFWDALRNQAIRNFETICSDTGKKLQLSLGAAYLECRVSAKLDIKRLKYLGVINTLTKFGKYIGIFATCCLIGILICIGLAPELKISGMFLTCFIFLVVFSSPLCLLIANIYVWHAKGRLEEFGEQHDTVLKDLKDALDNA
ncbi:hypothetical protein [Shewanella pealeana]|uniref:hypothetical protein n=1 Tax=Shewanella pealeana TaxID=70864 RepID=UPI00059D7F8D|nr:hypothetical protein [Shewanella pealeana]